MTKGTIDADATAWVSYEGKIITGNELDKVYDPAAGYAFDKFKFGVKDANGKDVKASDYTVKIVDQDGKEYKSGDTMKNAGTYSIVIESSAYEISNQTAVTFTISPMDMTDVTPGVMTKFDESAIEYVPFKKGGYDVAGLAVPGAANNELKIVLEQYDAKTTCGRPSPRPRPRVSTVTATALNSELAPNYTFATENGTVAEFRVVESSKVKFYDVAPSEWYSTLSLRPLPATSLGSRATTTASSSAPTTPSPAPTCA